MKNKIILVIGIFLLLVILIIYVRSTMSTIEIPSYKVIQSFENIEIREYAPAIVAQVEVPGERKIAINTGFRLLADYIFGNNVSKEKIAMTAPVVQQKGQKIAMTAPVTQIKENDQWLVEFTMPSEYTMDNLPKPNNPRVLVKNKEMGLTAAIRFSGVWSQSSLDLNQAKLNAYLGKNNYKQMGEAEYAFYNPPWTLPFLRRNEIIFKIKK